ncbi:MAG: hypothetical protein NC347_05520 [Clostridium sp.]|nr:hypothetical protein [Clostridium sp.]
MELKLADDEKNDKQTGSLRLSGAGEGKGTGGVPEQDNPWDFDKPEEPIVTRSIQSSVTVDSGSYGGLASDVHIVVKLGRILVYACMFFMIASMIWIVTQPKIDLYMNTRKISPLFSLCAFVVIVDSILVNVLYERKISLIFWAWFLMLAYPLKRDNHVNGGGPLGGLTCFGMLIAYVAFFASIMTSFSTYGKAVMNEDATVRSEIVAFMEQPVAGTGDNFESRLKQNLLIQNIEVVTQGNQRIVVVQGNGEYGANKDGLVEYMSKTVATQLAFVKDTSGNYQIGAAMLGDVTLSNQYLEYYWNTCMK